MCLETNSCGNFMQCECSVLQGAGWASSQNPPKGCFSKTCKKLSEKMLWEWTEKLWNWTRKSLKVLSSPNHSDTIIVCEPASCYLSSSQWAIYVWREESYFTSSFSGAL